MTRIIAHVDMDAFFASVEQRDNPTLKGKPVIVGGRPEGRGVVSAASYEARKFGVHSAMPTARALRLCPQAVLISSNFGSYREASNQIRDVFYEYTSLVEPLSLDEAFLDLSGKISTLGEVKRLGAQIKRDIFEKTKLTCSVGMAPNKFLAKLSSEQNKPDGLFVLRPNEVDDFLDSLTIDKLWGVGPSTHRKLEKLGIDSVRTLRQWSLAELVRQLGSHGAHLWNLSRGQDKRKVTRDRPHKSISKERTFSHDLIERDEMKHILKNICEATLASVKRNGFLGKTIHIKVRLSDFTTLTRNLTLAWPTQDAEVAWRAVERLFDKRVDLQGQGVRLLGVGVSGLSADDSGQLPLFPYDELAQL